MRRDLGRSFALVRLGWAFLVGSLAAGLPRSRWTRRSTASRPLFGLALIGGWLLTFLLGILQRIVPFLASMHAGQARTPRQGPAADTLGADRGASAGDPFRLPSRGAGACSRWRSSPRAPLVARGGRAGRHGRERWHSAAFFATVHAPHAASAAATAGPTRCRSLDPHQLTAAARSGNLVSQYQFRGSDMSFRRQVSHALDDEHRANLELLGRVEQVVRAAPRARPARAIPSSRDSPARSPGTSSTTSAATSTSRSASSFRGWPTRGDGDIAGLLAEEHEAIRAVADELLPLARAAAAGTLDEAGWASAASAARWNWSNGRSRTSRRKRWRSCRCSTTCSTRRPIASSRSRTRPADAGATRHGQGHADGQPLPPRLADPRARARRSGRRRRASTPRSRAGRAAPTSSGASPPRCATRSCTRNSRRPTRRASPATSSRACSKANSAAASPGCGSR